MFSNLNRPREKVAELGYNSYQSSLKACTQSFHFHQKDKQHIAKSLRNLLWGWHKENQTMKTWITVLGFIWPKENKQYYFLKYYAIFPGKLSNSTYFTNTINVIY